MPQPDPIQNLDSIDIVGAMKDGGVHLLIVASSRLDGSADHQRLLFKKIDSYLGFMGSPDFKEEFGEVPAGKIFILLRYAGDPHPVMFTVFRKCAEWVEQSGARFRAEPLPVAG